MKTLIVYYSRTGTTRKVALGLGEKLGADIEEITCQNYSKGPLGYVQAGKDAMQKKPGIIGESKKSLENYDMVIIGGPIWGWNVCPPIRAFCREAKGKLKQTAFFCTMGGDGSEKAFVEMEKECGIHPIATLFLMTKEVVSGDYSKKLDDFIKKLINSNN